MKAKILWIEGKRADGPPFVPELRKKGYEVTTASSGDEALGILARVDPDLVVVNAASLRTSGKRICREVRKHAARVPILLITPEPPSVTDGYPPIDLVITTPYTTTKLIRSIKPYLKDANARLLWVKARNLDASVSVGDLRRKNFHVDLATEKDDLTARLAALQSSLVVIDTAALGSTARVLSRTLRSQRPDVPVALIVDSDASTSSDVIADVILSLPFTPRKLINRIKPLMPGDGGHRLHVGPIRLDMELKRVQSHGRESTLTPRLAQLLKVFMDHPGEALERGRLFREVWNTEYTGDTRTLDVHISWLRLAIEEDPRNPRFLKTIRGLGYRLDA